MPGSQGEQCVDAMVRAMASAARSLRLYPPSSPIPRESLVQAADAIAECLSGRPVLSLAVTRSGFSASGLPVAVSPAVGDLAQTLRGHGVAELDVLPGCSTDELLSFLQAVLAEPGTVLAEGGLSAVLLARGVERVRVMEVALTVVETGFGPAGDEMADDFLAELAADPGRLATWLSTVARGDQATLADGLLELADASGTEGRSRLLASLTEAFGGLDPEGRDAILGLGIDGTDARPLVGEFLARLGTDQVAGAVTGGLYGKNMLSLSNALTCLPLGGRLDAILSEVRSLLPTAGHTSKEADFLDHMLAVRSSKAAEQPLLEAEVGYRQVAEVASVDEAAATRARDGVTADVGRTEARAVATMLSLLDQQSDFTLYRKSVESLAGMVRVLVRKRELELADRVIAELAAREGRAVQPWPELTAILTAAIEHSLAEGTMTALLEAVEEDASLVPVAQQILRRGGEVAQTALTAAALALPGRDGLELAAPLLGRRLADTLPALAANAQWFQVAPIARHLACASDPRANAALDGLLKRGDDQSRREAAKGLAASGSPAALSRLSSLMRDPSMEVAVAAARLTAHSGIPGSGAAIAARLGEIDVDGKDFRFARELIGCLARVPEAAATDALRALVQRRALIKRGDFAQVQELARQALEIQAKGGER